MVITVFSTYRVAPFTGTATAVTAVVSLEVVATLVAHAIHGTKVVVIILTIVIITTRRATYRVQIVR